MFTDNIDWEEIRDLSKKGLTIKDLNQKLYIPERDRGMVEEIVSIIKSTDNPRVLVFCRSITHSERLFSFLRCTILRHQFYITNYQELRNLMHSQNLEMAD